MKLKKIKHIFFIIVMICCISHAKAQTVTFNTKDTISNIVLPNVFTPNFDGINDIYKPYCDEIIELSFSIYNRNGTLIFETNRINGFWDGRTTAGEYCKDGVYFCVLTATGIEGKKYSEKVFIQLFTNGYYNN
ncbi:MAG: gliding motility-associated C-terminal domain-containing protein [Bacteroidota bacterium]